MGAGLPVLEEVAVGSPGAGYNSEGSRRGKREGPWAKNRRQLLHGHAHRASPRSSAGPEGCWEQPLVTQPRLDLWARFCVVWTEPLTRIVISSLVDSRRGWLLVSHRLWLA